MNEPAPSTPARLEVEISTNTVAVVKLPLPVKSFAEISEALGHAFGDDLMVTERPRGWMTFFKPEPPPLLPHE